MLLFVNYTATCYAVISRGKLLCIDRESDPRPPYAAPHTGDTRGSLLFASRLS